MVGVLAFFFDFGFSHSSGVQISLNEYYFVVLAMGILACVLRYVQIKGLSRRRVFVFDLLSVCFSILIIYLHFVRSEYRSPGTLFYNDNWIKFAVFLTFIREFSEIRVNYKRTLLNPAQLFLVSFVTIIFIGALLLMMPGASYQGLSFVNALFTATSAVCVTGLVVVDTGSYFTDFGQVVIMLLIQVGGLGILTFASYFSYFFKGGATYENQLVLSDMTNSNKIGEVFSILKYILVITFTIELISGILIFSSLDPSLFQSEGEVFFFSAFHAISAFCNAGFSTLEMGLYDPAFRHNYYLHLVLLCTFGLGGLGFPIVSNLIQFMKYKASKIFFSGSSKSRHKPWVLNLNSRITLVTTFSLTTLGFLAFYFLEYHNTLSEHHGFGKVVTALFGAATPRTAGFNTIDTSAMGMSTLMIILFLMWIGASPSSTGGGIKTSTFAIATLNVLSLAKGKSRIELMRREIADISVRRAFAIIALSLMVIGLGITLIVLADPAKSLIAITFECFSAYSTVGLSLGITPDLSTISKLVLVVIMFVGRVSMLTVLIAVFKKIKHKNYRYPTEEILMN